MTQSNCNTCYIANYGDLNCMHCEHKTMAYTFTLPFPPSINHYWKHRVVRNRAVVYTSAQGKEFQKQVYLILGQKGLSLGLKDLLTVDIILRPPNRVRRDLDNYGGKALLDAITRAGFWKDDSQIIDLHMHWGPVIKGGETIVSVQVA